VNVTGHMHGDRRGGLWYVHGIVIFGGAVSTGHGASQGPLKIMSVFNTGLARVVIGFGGIINIFRYFWGPFCWARHQVFS